MLVDDRLAAVAARAAAEYDALELDALPAALTRNGLDYYYLSVWPGLRQLSPISSVEVPPRLGPVHYGYVHLPFCSGLCDFCSYFVVVSRDDLHDARIDAHIDALLVELELNQARADISLTYLYIGGGTPSLIGPERMARLLDGFRARGALAPELLGTVELHPEFFADEVRSGEFLAVLEAHGIKRVSLGLQTDDDALLQATNRRHGPAFLAESIALLRARGFLVNVDLMYGLPEQSLASWLRSVEAAIALETDSISTYFTFVDSGTRLAREVARGLVGLPAHRLIQTQHIAAQLMLEARGYLELPSDFWSVPTGDPRQFTQDTLPSDANSLALGAGAYGYYNGMQFFNQFSLKGYRELIGRGELPLWRGAKLTPSLERCRDIMFSFKNAPALNLERFEARHGVSPLDSHSEVFETLWKFELAEVDGRTVRLTRKGRLVVEEIACLFEPAGHHRPVPGNDERRLLRHNFAPTYSAGAQR